MERIESVNNERVKRIISLKDKSARRETGLFIVEGYNNIKDCPIKAEEIFVCSDFNKPLPECDNVYYVSQRVADKIADTVTTQGIFGVYRIPDTNVKAPTGAKAMVLDGISDSGNIGTIIRTAVACGYSDIYFHNCADVFSPKVVRSAMSAIFKLNVSIGTAEEILSVFKANGFTPYILDMNGKNVFETEFNKPAFIVGSEAHGVSDEFRASVKDVISLPMDNMESLNAGVAAGVVMYVHAYGLKK